MPTPQTTCPLCGERFDPTAASACPSCPLNSSCTALCCPQCHYSFPAETPLAARLRRLLGRLGTRRDT